MMLPLWCVGLVGAVIGYALLGWVWHSWLRRGGKLSHQEIDDYLQQLQTGIIAPQDFKDEFIERMRIFGRDDDGKPVYNLNLLKFHGSIEGVEGIDEQYASTPEQSNAYYEKHVMPVIVSIGGLPLYSGSITGKSITPNGGEKEDWDRSLIVYYPDRRAFFKLVTHPDYMKVVPYKIGALQVTLLPTEKEMTTPFSVTYINMMTFTLNIIFNLTRPFRS